MTRRKMILIRTLFLASDVGLWILCLCMMYGDHGFIISTISWICFFAMCLTTGIAWADTRRWYQNSEYFRAIKDRLDIKGS